MGWRFRHSFKVIPGVRLNLSKTGLSCSIGGAPLTLNVGPRGVFGTASLPGSGVSYRQQLLGGSGTGHQPHSFLPPQSAPNVFPSLLPTAPLSSAPLEEIRSDSTELLTSESLKQLKQVIQTAYQEHEEISSELDAARAERQKASDRFSSWDDGFLFKRIFKKRFAQRKVELETAEAKVDELEQQLRLTTIATNIEIENEQAQLYFRMRDEFAALSESAAIWDIKAQRATDKFRERTVAERRVERQRVSFSLGSCDLIQWEQNVPHLENANGGDLYLYPGFILYRAAREAFSLIDFRDLNGKAVAVKFQEEESLPNDSKVIGQTWAKANKDGSRDRRFVGNYQIPVVLYGSLILKSEGGLWEEFQFSCPERLERFLHAFNAFVSSLQPAIESASVT